MKKTVYHVAKMDCPCEENLVRMKLSDVQEVASLSFSLSERTVTVCHQGESAPITQVLETLQLGATQIKSVEMEAMQETEDTTHQRNVLWIVLGINFGLFLVEILTGWLSGSMGLIADSLDMLADALVYGMSLWAVGATIARKKRVALFSGLLQLGLAVGGFAEVIHRFIELEETPHYPTMIGVSLVALAGNAVCLWLLQRTQSKEVHIQASVIFSANDVIVNIGVILAAVCVALLHSPLPDLVIGTVVFALVMRGAVRILLLSR